MLGGVIWTILELNSTVFVANFPLWRLLSCNPLVLDQEEVTLEVYCVPTPTWVVRPDR
jgi:hypothetical protein